VVRLVCHPGEHLARHTFLPVFSALLRGHPSGDFTHWCQERQIAIVSLNRFIRDTDNLGFSEARCERLGTGEVEVGEDELPLFQQVIFALQRLFYLKYQIGLEKYLLAAGGDSGPARS